LTLYLLYFRATSLELAVSSLLITYPKTRST